MMTLSASREVYAESATGEFFYIPFMRQAKKFALAENRQIFGQIWYSNFLFLKKKKLLLDNTKVFKYETAI